MLRQISLQSRQIVIGIDLELLRKYLEWLIYESFETEKGQVGLLFPV